MSRSLPKLFVIGSSATLLLGPYLQQMTAGVFSYSRKGEEASEIREAFTDLDVPQGASAGDSSMVLEYLKALDQTGAFKPDIVLIHVGMHDIKRNSQTGRNQVPLEDYRRNVGEIVEWFKARNIRLVWMRIGPLDEALHNARSKAFHRYQSDLDAYNEAADAIVNENNVPMLDLPEFTRTLGPMDQLLKDHIHFKDDIVRLQAAFIAGYLALKSSL